MNSARVRVSDAGLVELYSDEAFLREIVGIVGDRLEGLDEPFDESDAWWWLCSVIEQMQRYGRKDLKRTARAWAQRIRLGDVLRARELAYDGKFDHLIPQEARRRVATG